MRFLENACLVLLFLSYLLLGASCSPLVGVRNILGHDHHDFIWPALICGALFAITIGAYAYLASYEVERETKRRIEEERKNKQPSE